MARKPSRQSNSAPFSGGGRSSRDRDAVLTLAAQHRLPLLMPGQIWLNNEAVDCRNSDEELKSALVWARHYSLDVQTGQTLVSLIEAVWTKFQQNPVYLIPTLCTFSIDFRPRIQEPGRSMSFSEAYRLPEGAVDRLVMVEDLSNVRDMDLVIPTPRPTTAPAPRFEAVELDSMDAVNPIVRFTTTQSVQDNLAEFRASLEANRIRPFDSAATLAQADEFTKPIEIDHVPETPLEELPAEDIRQLAEECAVPQPEPPKVLTLEERLAVLEQRAVLQSVAPNVRTPHRRRRASGRGF